MNNVNDWLLLISERKKPQKQKKELRADESRNKRKLTDKRMNAAAVIQMKP